MPESRSNDALVDERPLRRRRRIWPWVLRDRPASSSPLWLPPGSWRCEFFGRGDGRARRSRSGQVAAEQRHRARPQRRSAQFDSRVGPRSSATPRAPTRPYRGRCGSTRRGCRSSVRTSPPCARRRRRRISWCAMRCRQLHVLGAMQRDNIRFEGGGFNLEPFRQAIGRLPAVDAAFAQAQDKVAGIDRAELLPIVDDAVGQVLDVIEDAAPISHTAPAVLPTALKMLGDDGPRHLSRAVPEQRRDPRDRRCCCGGRLPSCGRRAPRPAGPAGSTTSSPVRWSDVQTLGFPLRRWRSTTRVRHLLAELHAHAELSHSRSAVPGQGRCADGTRGRRSRSRSTPSCSPTSSP